MEQLTPLANSLITAFIKTEKSADKGSMAVSPLVVKIASIYEKIRVAMDYREEEVVLRSVIERIVKRRILFSPDSRAISEALLRELVWGRYIKDQEVSEELIVKIQETVDIYLQFRNKVGKSAMLSQKQLGIWTMQLLSCAIEQLVSPHKKKDLMSNFMLHVIQNSIQIEDEQVRSIQTFLAVRRAFSKDDIALLRYHLFIQYFDVIDKETILNIAGKFPQAYLEIQKALAYPQKDKIAAYVKQRSAIFLILEDLLGVYLQNFKELAISNEQLEKAVFAACQARYDGIGAKVKRAVIRSFIFVLFTKVFFALSVEGTFENIFYGSIQWLSLSINTAIPPLLMAGVGFVLPVPGKENSEQILAGIKTILFEKSPNLGEPFVLRKTLEKKDPGLYIVFTILWLMTYLLSFGALILLLSMLQFTLISQAIFLFFIAVVSFLAYRIGLLSRTYVVGERQGWITPLVDFFFMPIVRVGRDLTEGISQINVILFIFDFIIETPFKGMFGFLEQWFLFIHAKRENLG